MNGSLRLFPSLIRPSYFADSVIFNAVYQRSHATANFKHVRNFTSESNAHKLSYFHKPSTEPLEYVTLGQSLEAAANKWPDRKALISLEENVTLTYSELLQKADVLAASFKEIGLEKGDRIGIWAPNCWAWLVVNYAAIRTGLVVVTINPLYQKNEIENCINKVGIKAIAFIEKIGPLHFYKTICEVAPELTKCEPGNLISQNVPTLKTVLVLSEENFPGAFNYKTLAARATPQGIQRIASEQHLIQSEDICNIQFTSGTTSDPKAVILTHYGFTNGARIAGKEMCSVLGHIIACVQLPFFHVFAYNAFCSAAPAYGVTLCLPSIAYNPKNVYRAIRKEKCNVVYGTPTMFVDMLAVAAEDGGEPPESLRIAFSGGAPTSPQFFTSMKKRLKVEKIMTGFGMTETSSMGFITSMKYGASEVKDNVGKLIDHLEAKIIDTNGNAVPMGEPGELCLRGFCVMKGYWNDQKRTKEVLDTDGWLKTGDQAVLYENGYVRIVGRLKDVIIRGGENVYPKEIEDIVNTHENILEAHVFGISDDRLGEEICIAVREKDGAAFTLEQLRSFCDGKLSKFKIPKHLRVVQQFPKTATGKIQKFRLKILMENGTL